MDNLIPIPRFAASEEFEIWKAEASLVDFGFDWTPPQDVAEKFNSLSTVRIPKELAQYKLDPSRHSDRFMKFVKEIQNWAKDTGGPEKMPGDYNRIMARLADLIRVFSEISHHWLRGECGNEIMRSVDALFELVFDDVNYTAYKICQPMRLRQTGRVATMRAQPDRLLVIQCPELSCDLVQQAKSDSENVLQDILDEAAWEDAGTMRSIIALPVEFRRRGEPLTVALNQLSMDFATAQNQRRALNLPDRPLFGFLYHDGALRVFSATWVNDAIHVYFHMAFMVVMPREFMIAFSFLHGLREYVSDLHDELSNLDLSETVRSLKRNRWRAQVMLAITGGISVEEVDEGYEEDDESSAYSKSPVLSISSEQVKRNKSSGPPSLVTILKQWVKNMIMYYLSVFVKVVHDYLGRY